MARKTKAEVLAAVHERALKRFKAIWQAMYEERTNCQADRRFYSIAGAQWEGNLGEQFKNKPMFEINKISLAMTRIFNEYRNNRIGVQFRRKDEDTSEKSPDMLTGLFRADEQDSGAQEAYDNAFEEGVGGGFGCWRLRNVKEEEDDDDDERQRIAMEPIYDADLSVFFDLDAKRYDKKDADHAFVLSSLSPDGYESKYPDFPKPASFPRPLEAQVFDWWRPTVVYVAEYYEVVKKPTTEVYFKGLDGTEEEVELDDLDEETLADLQARGFVEDRRETNKKRRVHKYILNGAEVIEDCGLIAGPNIPLVPFYGKRWFVANVERCCGHVRTSKDAQRLKNMQTSRLAEIAAMSAIEKPIFAPQQIKGFEKYWAEDNVENYPYALAHPLRNPDDSIAVAGPQAYTKAPSIPPAMAALLQVTEQDMQDLLGNQQAGEQLQANVSAKAVELVQGKLDMQTFIYMDNAKKSAQRAAEIWLGMAREVYVEEGRKLKSVSEQGKAEFVTIMQPAIDPKTSATTYDNDLSKGRFDVIADVGPSYQTRRDATVRSLTGVLTATQDPEIASILTSMILMNIDGEGLEDLNAYMRKRNIARGVVKPTDEEAKELEEAKANAPADPQAEYMKAAADQATADATLKRAKTAETVASAGLKHAQTVATMIEAHQPVPAVGALPAA